MPLDPLFSPMAQPSPTLLEVAHVAHRLSASQEFVRRLIRDRKLAAIRLGTRWRVDPVDLQAFIDAQRQANGQNGHGNGQAG
jgi:excisionase family DNA binding protein